MATSLDRNFSDLAGLLMQRRQQQMQETENAKQNRLRDLQFKQLQREDDYQAGLAEAMANPGTISKTTIAPDAKPSLANLMPGNQLQPVQFQPQGPQVGPLRSRVQTTETPRSRAAAGAEYALSQGKVEDAIKLFSVDDHVAQLRAKGDLQGYYEAKRELDEGNKFLDLVKENRNNLDAVWPQLQRMFPQQSAGINPQDFQFTGNAVLAPFEMNGQIVPNRGVYRDDQGKTHIIDTTPKPDQEAIIDKRFENQRQLTQMQIEAADRRAAADRAAADRRANKKDAAKPLPVSALKLQQESTDAIGTASGIRADLGAIRRQVESGELKLGPIRNLAGAAANAAGISTQNSRNLATFKTTLEKLRNDSLRLNKGVQTDGDAQRAWNELMDNINDPGVVKQRLAEIDRINERAVVLHQANIDNIRNNYGQAPLDTSAQTNLKPAVGRPVKGQGGKQLDATSAQKFLRQAGGNKDRARELARKAGYSF